jgi:hypothetical protein
MTKKRTPRTERRAGEHRARKLVREKQRLAALEVGGAPDRPIEVTSSPVIDVRARSLRCPLCDGAYRLDDHTAATHEGRSLRIAHVTCQQCGVARQLWFRITSPLPN